MNFTDFLPDAVMRHGDAQQIFMENGAITVSRMDEIVWLVAMFLRQQGVGPGTVVALRIDGIEDHFVSALAVARLGATIFVVAGDMPTLGRDALLQRAGVKHWVTDQRGSAPTYCAELNLTSDLVNGATQEIDRSVGDPDPDAPWLLLPRFRHDGELKLLPISHEAQVQRLAAAAEVLPLAAGDTFHCLAHMESPSTKARFCEAIVAGANVLMTRPRGLSCLSEIGARRPTSLAVTVYHAERIVAEIRSGRIQIQPPLKSLVLSSSRVSMNLRETLRHAITEELFVRFGSQESGTISVAGPPEIFDHEDSLGRPLSYCELELVDCEDQPVATGETGQVRVRGPANIQSYLGDDGGDRALRDGWAYTGDLARLGEGGQLCFTGRADDLLIVDGTSVYPTALEGALLHHAAVGEARVVGFPSETSGHFIVAAVATGGGARVSELELLRHIRQYPGGSLVHRIYRFDELPKEDASGEAAVKRLLRIAMDRKPYALQSDAGPYPGALRPRQISEQIAFNFRETGPQDFSQLEHWFALLEEQEHLGEALPYRFPDELPQSSRDWLNACMRLIRVCFQSAYVPVFDLPHVVRCQLVDAGQRTWQVTFTVPYLVGLPGEVVQLALDTANRILAWALRVQPDDNNRTILFNTVQQLFIDAMQGKFMTSPSPYWILEGAYRLGIPFRHVGTGTCQLGWGARAKLNFASATEDDSGIGVRLATSKSLSAKLLRAAGLPAASHHVVESVEKANEAAAQLGWPVVVKPDDCEHGDGVSLNIRDNAALADAFREAQKLSRSKQVIVEQQVKGRGDRLFVAGDALLYVAKRPPLELVGDGISTISELHQQALQTEEVRPPWRQTLWVPIDDLARECMGEEGFVETDVPAVGVRVPLRPFKADGKGWGGSNVDVSERVHPENVRVALEAARLFGLSVAGIDLITTDISRPWYENGAVINEVNSSPALGVSPMSRSYLPAVLKGYIPAAGRIPIEVFVGGDAALNAARSRWEALLGTGLAASLTTAQSTSDPGGTLRPLPFDNLYRRVYALTMSRSVEAIVMVVQSDEFVHGGLPVEWVDRLEIIDREIDSFVNPGALLTDEEFDTLERLLRWWVSPSSDVEPTLSKEHG
ncbi:MAG: AMP-binding protein [Pseudomonadota bacterium]